MSQQSIAIVGLGRVGSVFLEGLLNHDSDGISVIAVSEQGDTPGRKLAQAKGIPVVDIDALIAKGDSIDILFDLTGTMAVRKELRDKMMASNNRHTLIATEAVAQLIWSLISSEGTLPNVHAKVGY
jgi:predicted dinucleotide-utilizing enzyme